MKQLQIDLKERLLIVELHKESEYEIKKDGIVIKLFGKYQTDIIKGDFEFICNGLELTEEIARDLVIELSDVFIPLYKNHNGQEPIFEAMQSFISAINASGHHWRENPEKKSFFNPEEFIQEEYERYMEAESRTFTPEKCLIFEIL